MKAWKRGMCSILLLCGAILAAGGCSRQPVRHLASDAALVKAGETSRREVLLYLGEPDARRTVAPGVEEFLYYSDRTGRLGKMPFVGKKLDEAAYETITVTLEGDLVTSCVFRSYDADEDDWTEGVEWEKVK